MTAFLELTEMRGYTEHTIMLNVERIESVKQSQYMRGYQDVASLVAATCIRLHPFVSADSPGFIFVKERYQDIKQFIQLAGWHVFAVPHPDEPEEPEPEP